MSVLSSSPRKLNMEDVRFYARVWAGSMETTDHRLWWGISNVDQSRWDAKPVIAFLLENEYVTREDDKTYVEGTAFTKNAYPLTDKGLAWLVSEGVIVEAQKPVEAAAVAVEVEAVSTQESGDTGMSAISGTDYIRARITDDRRPKLVIIEQYLESIGADSSDTAILDFALNIASEEAKKRIKSSDYFQDLNRRVSIATRERATELERAAVAIDSELMSEILRHYKPSLDPSSMNAAENVSIPDGFYVAAYNPLLADGKHSQRVRVLFIKHRERLDLVLADVIGGLRVAWERSPFSLWGHVWEGLTPRRELFIGRLSDGLYTELTARYEKENQ